MNIVSVSLMAPSSGQNQQIAAQTGDSNAFAHIIASLRQETKTLQPFVEAPEIAQTVDWEQLQQWFAQLPVYDGYAEKQTLSNDAVQAFLSLLPEETKNDMIERFSSGQPLEMMFSPKDERNVEDELMLVLALFQLEQKQWTIPEPIIEQVRQMMQTTFGMRNEQSGTITAMLQALTKEMNESEKRTNDYMPKQVQSLLKDVPLTVPHQKEEKMNTKAVSLPEDGRINMKAVSLSKDVGINTRAVSLPEDGRINMKAVSLSKDVGINTKAASWSEDGQINTRAVSLPEDGRMNTTNALLFKQGTQAMQKEFLSPLQVPKELVTLQQESKQSVARLYEHVLHVGQQTNEHAPMGLKTIDTTKDTPFVTQFERILRTSKLTQWKNGNTQMLIRLHPEHLGYVTIKLIQQKGKLTAKMITSTDAAKQLVEQHIHQLSHIVDHITVEKFHVFDEAKFRDHSFQQQKQQHQEQQKEQKKQHDESFDEWLKEWIDFEKR
ncbi:Flagellar hook-length control protein FliK [Anoxybacillus thermarum]|uniref:Flagellar hook-length control protein FliK n=1 Tax=Anoxybacillus thermarum TaxID=404937 RepID=A0A0D0R0K8_9BACL|nr:flagellar hook-length control protein FliK [Anoxybacillus thermarum]KIQ95254.1 Flagellar hook-length control protein FliK [Anoxybacillus thermarum]